MSLRDKYDGGSVQETNLDEVEIDVDGNLSYELGSSVDAESNVDAMEVDEDGNIRIQSASRLLNETREQKEADGRDSGLTAEERRVWQRRHSDKRHYSEEERDGEGMEMLEMDSFEREGDTGDSVDQVHSHDLHDIEMTVFERRDSAVAVESHPVAANVHHLERGDQEQPDTRTKSTGLSRVLDILFSSSPQRLMLGFAIAVVVIGVLLTVSLLPASFVYVEYYELALAKNRVSGRVNRKDVYYPGCHLLTPDIELVRFQGTAHTVMQTLEIVTSDRLSFNLHFSLQYFIKPEELGQLFTEYKHDYAGVVESMIESSVKNTGVQFSLDDFRLNRSHVEHTLKQAVALRLGGNCCPSCCPFQCGGRVNCHACRLSGRGCSKGIHMEMRHFQMGAVDIPEEVSERFLRQTILLIEAEKELFLQRHAVETKISERMQKEILNEASEIREAAAAESKKLRTIAEAEYERKVQKTYAGALKKFYRHLNITKEDHKLSFMYIRALEDISDKLYNLNYDQLSSFT